MGSRSLWPACLCALWERLGPDTQVPLFSTLGLFSERRGQSGFPQAKALDIYGP